MKEHYEQYWSGDSAPPDSDPLSSKRAEILWNLADAPRPDGSSVYLDVGCGTGWLVADASKRGFDARGMDIASAVVTRAKALFPDQTFLQHSVELRPWPFEPASVDLMSSFEVIEHLLEPVEFLAGVADCLKPGGYAAISTPYHGLAKNVALALKGFDRHFNVSGDHIRFFTDPAISTLMASQGLQVERFVHFGRFAPFWAGTIAWARRI